MTAPFRRAVFDLPIRARRKGFELDVAGPGDFEAGPPTPSPAPAASLADAMPYCFDPVAERVIYARTPDLPAVLAAPFFYQGQYRAAAALASVPLERLDELEPGAPSPTFVLSPSRCGTTLLAMLLRDLGQPVAAEPDVFTQAAALPLAPEARLALIRGAAAALGRALGPRVTIKLRDHCNPIAVALARAAPAARMAILLRDRHAWAASRHRAFQDSPRALADIFRAGVMTVDALARAGRAPLVLWYEDLVADPLGALRRLGVPEAALAGASPAALLARDAQAGTPLARRDAAPALPAALLREFDAIWADIAPREALRAHGMARLLPAG